MRLRFLLDTNVLIPLQDSYIVLSSNLQNFIRLANKGGHQLLYHPASLKDIQRDSNTERCKRTLSRLAQYEELARISPCPWNANVISPNDSCDNEILYALECNAAHALVTEDKGIHAKAKIHGLSDRVYNIQTAEDWLQRLHNPKDVCLPNIEDIPLYSLSSELSGDFFNSLRDDYQPFNDWFASKAKEGRRAWICRNDNGALGAICIYTIQENEKITDSGEVLSGKSLKLCTFKVGETVRGRKIGELFLKAAFRYASENECLHIFIHGNAKKQLYLAELLECFGFFGKGSYETDVVWIKEHPVIAPVNNISAKEYVHRYFPHFRQDQAVTKYIIPIRPKYHDILFPDYFRQIKQFELFPPPKRHVGNAIKLAYLCHAKTKLIKPGDILFFYRSHDDRMLTTIGVVDDFKTLKNSTEIAALVSRRTVYSYDEIEHMSNKDVRVILFRLIKHLPSPISIEELKNCGAISGPPQSIVKLNESKYRSLANVARM